ncbi:MAG: hypothetical protein JSS86_11325 [Cyanobacteria bacterium SZAS LIN-2]|nr:hypothetical protein [Cyanobacteria bacterium SZAS LIN-3]MBS1996897.1 hypothetical protein [Cyanobacteria bacterium SZAS LIN-2]
MSIIGYIFCGVHVAAALFLLLASKRANHAVPYTLFFLGLGDAYFAASDAPSGVLALSVLEVVAIVRLVLNGGILSTAGSSVSRHTVKVFSKSFWASFFTCLLTSLLFLITLQVTFAKYAILAFPAFFAVEYAFRLRRAAKAQAFIDGPKK